MTRHQATYIGFIAVLLWALLALFTVGTAPVPPLLLAAICFATGGTLGLIWSLSTGGFARLRQVPFASMPMERWAYLAITRSISAPCGWRPRPRLD